MLEAVITWTASANRCQPDDLLNRGDGVNSINSRHLEVIANLWIQPLKILLDFSLLATVHAPHYISLEPTCVNKAFDQNFFFVSPGELQLRSWHQNLSHQRAAEIFRVRFNKFNNFYKLRLQVILGRFCAFIICNVELQWMNEKLTSHTSRIFAD